MSQLLPMVQSLKSLCVAIILCKSLDLQALLSFIIWLLLCLGSDNSNDFICQCVAGVCGKRFPFLACLLACLSECRSHFAEFYVPFYKQLSAHKKYITIWTGCRATAMQEKKSSTTTKRLLAEIVINANDYHQSTTLFSSVLLFDDEYIFGSFLLSC